MGSWLQPDREHTFEASGRTATIRPAPNVYALFANEDIAPHINEFLSGSVEDTAVSLRISEEICRAMMARPRIAEADESLPDDQDPEDPAVIPYSALLGGEVNELIGLWAESAERAARFRDGSDGKAGGDDGEGVGGSSKPAPRSRTRKSRSVAGRS